MPPVSHWSDPGNTPGHHLAAMGRRVLIAEYGNAAAVRELLSAEAARRRQVAMAPGQRPQRVFRRR
jgi:hypothetical protein